MKIYITHYDTGSYDDRQTIFGPCFSDKERAENHCKDREKFKNTFNELADVLRKRLKIEVPDPEYVTIPARDRAPIELQSKNRDIRKLAHDQWMQYLQKYDEGVAKAQEQNIVIGNKHSAKVNIVRDKIIAEFDCSEEIKELLKQKTTYYIDEQWGSTESDLF